MSYAAAARVKSPDAFRTISEVSEELQVPQHVLRFWEGRFAQVRPVKRAGGRRYYRPDDVDLLRGIRALLYGDGFTVKGVQKILRERGARYVVEIGRSVVPQGVIVLRRDSGLDESDEEPVNVVSIRRSAAPPEENAPAIPETPELPRLAEEERERLEILLAELVRLKGRLRKARS